MMRKKNTPKEKKHPKGKKTHPEGKKTPRKENKKPQQDIVAVLLEAASAADAAKTKAEQEIAHESAEEKSLESKMAAGRPQHFETCKPQTQQSIDLLRF